MPRPLRHLLAAFAVVLAPLALAACRGEPPARPRALAPATYDTTASGLRVHDITVGEGATAEAGDAVRVHYTGWLRADSTRFDSSVGGNPFRFRLGAGRVIAGWDEGVAGMQVGGVRSLVIPPDLGYGARGAGGAIPPGATLIFEVELLGMD